MKIYRSNRAGYGRIFGALLASLFMILPLSSQSQETPEIGDVESIVTKLKDYYASAADYQADFVQTTSHKMFQGKLHRSYGRVKFKSGGLMRWEYNRPEVKIFTYDGKTLWLYEPEVPQAFKFEGTDDSERLKKALAFLTGEGDILKEYRVKKLDTKKYGHEQGIVLGLWPKNPASPFKKVELYLDKETHRVARSVVVDHEGNRNRFDFGKPKLNNGLSQEIFSFTPPPGVQLVEVPKQ